MKILLFFLPQVICFDNYYIDNYYTDKILECGNKSNQAINIKWYEAEKGVFKNMSISNKKYEFSTALQFFIVNILIT